MRLRLFLLLALYSLAQAQPPDDAGAHYQLAQQYFRTHNLERAEQEAVLTLRLAPHMVEAENLLGAIAAVAGRLTEAEAHFIRVTQTRPRYPAAHFNLARIYFDRGDREAAQRELEIVLRLDRLQAGAHFYLGLILRDAKKSAEAVLHFEQARRLDPNNVDVLSALLACQLNLGQRAEAAKSFQALERQMNVRDPRLLQAAVVLARSGLYAPAMVAFRKILGADRESYDAGYNLALASFLSNDLVSAAAAASELIRRRDTAEAHNLLARIEEKRGAYLDALEEYRKAAAMEPGREDFRFDYCLILVQHQSFDFGLAQLTQAIQDFPKSARLWATLGAAHYVMSDYQKAVEELFRATELSPRLAQSYYYLARLYDKAGAAHQKLILQRLSAYLGGGANDAWAHYFYGLAMFEQQEPLERPDFTVAEAHLRQAIQLKTDLAEAHYRLALLLNARGALAESVASLRRAAQADPHMVEPHYRLALAYSKLGEKEKAQKEFQLQQKLRAEQADERAKRRKEFFEVIPNGR
jgi:tetratricopeptide (TPR) repeat protein